MEDTIAPPGWVHALPGRLRVKVAAIKKAPAAAAAAERALRQERGIIDALANPVTGSILIHYDPERACPQTVLAHLARLGLSAAAPAPSPLSEFSNELGKTLGKELVKMALVELISCGPMEVLCALI
jgi:heavy-metal-associated domain-containing protein